MTRFGAVASLAWGGLALAALSGCSGAKEEPAAQPAETNTATPAAGNEAAAAAPVAYASLTGDAAKGEKVFLQCKACHVVDPGVNRVGPSLAGIVGRTAGQIPGYTYSAANKDSGIVWTEEQMYTYLEAPQKTIPGTKMAFAGLKKPQDRADVIAYLKTSK